jgi:hypothetical protein
MADIVNIHTTSPQHAHAVYIGIPLRVWVRPQEAVLPPQVDPIRQSRTGSCRQAFIIRISSLGGGGGVWPGHTGPLDSAEKGPKRDESGMVEKTLVWESSVIAF